MTLLLTRVIPQHQSASYPTPNDRTCNTPSRWVSPAPTEMIHHLKVLASATWLEVFCASFLPTVVHTASILEGVQTTGYSHISGLDLCGTAQVISPGTHADQWTYLSNVADSRRVMHVSAPDVGSGYQP